MKGQTNLMNTGFTVAEIINLAKSRLTTIENSLAQATPGTYMLASDDFMNCIVQKGKGIKNTNVATYMLEPYIFRSKEIALQNNSHIYAYNGHGKILFIPIEASAYWLKLKQIEEEILNFLQNKIQ